jgi:hypothetical protein
MISDLSNNEINFTIDETIFQQEFTNQLTIDGQAASTHPFVIEYLSNSSDNFIQSLRFIFLNYTKEMNFAIVDIETTVEIPQGIRSPKLPSIFMHGEDHRRIRFFGQP